MPCPPKAVISRSRILVLLKAFFILCMTHLCEHQYADVYKETSTDCSQYNDEHVELALDVLQKESTVVVSRLPFCHVHYIHHRRFHV